MSEEKKYKVLKGSEELPEGSVVLESVLGENLETLLVDGAVEEVVDEEKTANEEAQMEGDKNIAADADVEAEHSAVKQLYYSGKLIVSDGMREVEGRQIHHVRLEDGTNTDLTDDEYKMVLETAK